MDVLGKLVLEVRDDDGVDNIAHGRVRGVDPAAEVLHPTTKAVITTADTQPPGSYNAHVVMVLLDDPRVAPRLPVHRALIGVRCYGRTRAEAAALRWAVSNAIHLVGPRLKANGLAIWQSLDASGGAQATDPDTQQPYEAFVVSALASTVAVT